MRGDVPVTKLDYIARQHDLDYLGSTGRFEADKKMVISLLRAYPMIPGIAVLTAIGFVIDNIVNGNRTSNMPNLQQYLEENYLKGNNQGNQS